MTYAKLLDKQHIKKICQVINNRNRMAQYSQRASVQLHTLLFFKDKHAQNDAFILSVKRSSISVIIPQYGLEGVISLEGFSDEDVTYEKEECYVEVNGHKLQVFDKVRVNIAVDSSNVQKKQIVMTLLNPDIKKKNSKRIKR